MMRTMIYAGIAGLLWGALVAFGSNALTIPLGWQLGIVIVGGLIISYLIEGWLIRME